MFRLFARLSEFWQARSLRFLLGFAVGIPITLLFGTIVTYDYYVNRAEAAKSLRIWMIDEVTARAKQLDRCLDDLARNPDRIALTITVQTPKSIDEMIALQRDMLDSNPIIYGTVIGWEPYAFDSQEKYCCPYVWRNQEKKGNLSTMMFNPENKYDYLTGWDWYDKPKRKFYETGQTNLPRYEPGLWSVPYFDEGGGNALMCTYSAPFFKQQKFAGVVTCDITTEWLTEFLINQPFHGGFFILLGQNGVIISHPDSNKVLNNISEIDYTKTSPNRDEVLAELNTAFQMFDDESTQRQRVRKEAAYLPGLSREIQGLFLPETVWTEGVQLSSTGWVLISVVPKVAVFEQSNSQYQWSFLIFVSGFFLFSIYLYWFINRNIIKPILCLTKVTNNVINGNFDEKIETSDKSGREIICLSQNFNSMLVTLRQSISAAVQNATARETAETANRTKGELLMLVSHELRTPLCGIIGTADLLMKTKMTEKQQEYVLIQKESGMLLLNVINNILDYSKLEFGAIKIEENDFDLRRLISNTVQTLRFHALSHNTTVKEEISSSLSCKVRGDEKRIQQVLLNLLSNAIKFSKNNEVNIRVVREGFSIKMAQNTKEESAVQLVHFEITNHGIEIPKEKQNNIFESYSDTTSYIDGLGIDLMISKYIIETLQGTIGVHSEPDKGTTFYFTLPLASVPLPREKIPKKENNLDKPVSGTTIITQSAEQTHHELPKTDIITRKRILVAEDNRINQIVVQEMLKASGYDYIVVENGRKAFEIWNEQNFDLILMDCQMPEMDGYEATIKIRHEEIRAKRQQIPIIALTANMAPGDKEHCLEIGMNAYCNKPIKAQELNSLILQLTETNSSVFV